MNDEGGVNNKRRRGQRDVSGSDSWCERGGDVQGEKERV